MSLHNLKEHPYLVLSPLINDHEEATSFITDNIDFLMKKLWRYKDPDSNNEQGKKEKLIQRVEIMDVFDDLLLIHLLFSWTFPIPFPEIQPLMRPQFNMIYSKLGFYSFYKSLVTIRSSRND